MKFILVTLAYGCIFIIVELLAKKFHAPGEATRKLSHILAGAGAALLPFFLGFNEIALLGAIFVPAVYLSMRKNIFTSVHKVSRRTYGEIYFPLAISVCALLFPDTLLFIYGVLVIGVSDALASLAGQRFGRRKLKVGAGQKSIVGSAVFFVTTGIIGATLVLVFLDAAITTAVAWAIVLAAILTIIEARASKGLDNLLVPVAASGLLGFVVALGFYN